MFQFINKTIHNTQGDMLNISDNISNLKRKDPMIKVIGNVHDASLIVHSITLLCHILYIITDSNQIRLVVPLVEPYAKQSRAFLKVHDDAILRYSTWIETEGFLIMMDKVRDNIKQVFPLIDDSLNIMKQMAELKTPTETK